MATDADAHAAAAAAGPAAGAGDRAAARERRALRLSIAVSLGFVVVALVWGLLARSQAILLDAIFTPVALLMTWVSLRASGIVAKGPTRRYPFGRTALIPLVVLLQAIVMVGTLAYVVVEAVRVMLSGGSEVSPVSLAAYGGVSAVVSVLTALALRRMGRDLPLIEAEAAGWLSAAVSSALIFAGGLIVLLLRSTPARGFEPYADSVLVIAGSLLLVPLPVMLVRKGLRELLGSVPDDVTQARVRDAVAAVAAVEGLPEPILRASKQGNTVTVEAAFVLSDDSGDAGDVDAADRVRRGIRDGLADLPYDVWIVVEFTHDAGLVE